MPRSRDLVCVVPKELLVRTSTSHDMSLFIYRGSCVHSLFWGILRLPFSKAGLLVEKMVVVFSRAGKSCVFGSVGKGYTFTLLWKCRKCADSAARTRYHSYK